MEIPGLSLKHEAIKALLSGKNSCTVAVIDFAIKLAFGAMMTKRWFVVDEIASPVNFSPELSHD